MIRSWLRRAVRWVLAGYRRARHARQRLKLGARLRRSGLRLARSASNQAAKLRRVVHRRWVWERKTGRLVRRRTLHAVVWVRQCLYYRAPGERRDCPACGSRRIRHVRPLAYSPPIKYLWRAGFISGCEACGLLFANPFPTDEHLADVYSAEGDWGRSRQQDEKKPASPARLARLFAPLRGRLDVLAPPPGSTVLDFGCGRGEVLDGLAGAGWTTYGVDPATKVAFRRHREVVDIPDTPTFHLVVLRQVLEHVAAPLAILRALARATHPGGFVVISVPNLDGMHEHGDRAYCLRSETHVMAYSSTCLEYLLNAAGFDLTLVEELDSSRKMAVIGQRADSAPTHGPAAPFAAALTALARYDARQGSGPTGGLPVRLQAAMLNWSRSLRGHRPRG